MNKDNQNNTLNAVMAGVMPTGLQDTQTDTSSTSLLDQTAEDTNSDSTNDTTDTASIGSADSNLNTDTAPTAAQTPAAMRTPPTQQQAATP